MSLFGSRNESVEKNKEIEQRLNRIENTISKCSCNNKFAINDSVSFIYANKLRKGKIISCIDSMTENKEYYIYSSGCKFVVPESQIAKEC